MFVENTMSQDPALYLSGIGFPLFHVFIIARIAVRVNCCAPMPALLTLLLICVILGRGKGFFFLSVG